MRKRIGKLPDGTYTSVGWCEHDGDRNESYRIECQLIVDGDELTIDLTNSDPQAPGPINTGPGAALGCSFTPIMLQLGYDLTLNSGLTEPVNVETREGTLPHVDAHGASGFGHLDAGHELCRLVTEVLSKAIQMSEDEAIHDRAQAPYGDDWSIETYAGRNQYGNQFAWLDMDGGGMGNGAQTVTDGLEAGGLSTQVGNRVSDVEWKEQSYPVLHLWRRLKANGGGPGEFRGGSGLDKAMTMWDSPSDQLVGAFLAARFNLPPRGYGGGIAGSATKLVDYEGADVRERWGRGELPAYPEEFDRESEHLAEAKEAPHLLTEDKVVRHVIASGGGLGDPLNRDPTRVEKDVRDGLVSETAARNAYGVVLNDDGEVDREATEKRRENIREERLDRAQSPTTTRTKGGTTTANPIRRFGMYLELAEEDGNRFLRCRECHEGICDVDDGYEDWRDHVPVDESEVADRMVDDFDMWVKRRDEDDKAVMLQYYCPGCATQLHSQTTLDTEKRPLRVDPEFL